MKRKPKILLLGSTLLLTMLTLVSLNALGLNSMPLVENDTHLKISLKLELPKPLELTYNTKTMYAWDAKGYGIILQIFNGYTLWADNYIANLELKTNFDSRIKICSERLIIKDKIIQNLSDDRDRAYALFNQERDDKPKLQRKNTIKIILFSGGALIVGAAAGILIGFFAGQ